MLKKLLIASSLSLYVTSKKSILHETGKPHSHQMNAVCIMNPEKGQTAKGIVRFSQDDYESNCIITAEFTGLKNNSKHGFHIHEFGDLTQGCSTAGPHYNPFNKLHGGPDHISRHVGDLGNVFSDSNGNAKYELNNKLISLVGEHSVIGRSCVLHENEDDLGLGNFPDSKTTGHSGGRIACGVIGLSVSPKKI